MKETILVPEERADIFNDDVSKRLKKNLGVTVERIGNSIEVEGEGIELMQAKNVVKAIARGFSPERAYRLLGEEDVLEIIDLKGYSESRAEVLKARIIGSKGKTRSRIEECTKAYVSVHGKTIGIIGTWEQVKNAKEAINMLLGGGMHKSVYSFLEKIRG